MHKESSSSWWSRLLLIAVGIVFGLVLAEISMRVAGYAIRSAQTRRNREALQRGHDFRIACVGESTTEGDGEHGRYPEMLEQILNAQEIGARVAVVNLGLSGAVTNDLVGILEEEIARATPDLVVTMMGINDKGRTHAYGSIIAPGGEKWYGGFRLYKLYRVCLFALDRWWRGPDAPQLVLGDGIVRPRAPVDFDQKSRWNAENPPSRPRDERTLVELDEVRAALERGEFDGVESKLLRLIDADPEYAETYAVLASYYLQTDRPDAAHEILLRGVARARGCSAGLHSALARSLFNRGDHEAAFATLRAILDGMLEPGNFGTRTHYMNSLAQLYESAGRLDDAERTLREIVEEVNPGNDIAYEPLIEFYQRHGRVADVARSREQQLRIRYQYVNPETRHNYAKLRQDLAEREIPLVAVQYPGRDVDALRAMLDRDSSVLFVDNSFFRERVERDGFERYYFDRFAGDFGHLSREGNCLLARNVARAIVERYFGRAFDDARAPCPPQS